MALSFYNPLEPSRLLDQNFGLPITTEDLIIPSYNFYNPNYFRPWKVSVQNAIQDFGSAISDEKDKFKICLDVQQFRPSEIMVKATKTDIIIEGRHEERADEHGYISRQFTRKYKLPDLFDSDTVMSNLTKDGVLIITATKKYLKTQEHERIIPIKMCEICPKAFKTSDMKEECNKKDFLQKEKAMERNTKMKEDDKFEQEMCMKSKISDDRKMSQNSDRIQSLKDDHLSLLNAGGALKMSMQGNSEQMSEEIIEKTCEKFDKLAAKSESGYSSLSCETMQSKAASFSSSTTYDLKSSNEKTSEYINEIIATELKQAADM